MYRIQSMSDICNARALRMTGDQVAFTVDVIG